jgi:hypothetical protein
MCVNQQIFGLKDFTDTLIDKADRSAAKSLVVYFFSDKVLTRTFKNKPSYHLQPLFCVLSDSTGIIKTHKLVDMKARFGDDFGIRFDQTKQRKLIPEALANGIRIDVSETLEFKGFKYYATKTFTPADTVKCVKILTDKLHPTAEVFKLLPKRVKADESKEDSDDCV